MLWNPTRRQIIRASGLIAAPAIVGRALAQIPMTGAGLGAPSGGGGLGLQTSLAAFWQLDAGTWLDSTGNGNTLTASGTPPTIVAGGPSAVSNTTSFVSTSSESLKATNNSGLQVGAGNFSIQAWIQSIVPNNVNIFVSKNDGGFANREWGVGSNFTSSNIWAWGLYDSTSTETKCNSTSSTFDTSFHHIVATWDGTTQRIYVDNAAASTAVPASPGISTTSNIFLGKDGDTGGFADCKISLVGIWKGRVLTSGNVASLWNSGGGLTYAQMA